MRPRRSGPTLEHLVIAYRMINLRETRRLSLDEAAHKVGIHPATLARIERARTSLDDGQITALLDIYEVRDQAQRQAILAALDQANQPGWWYPYADAIPDWQSAVLGVESAATLIRTWSPLIPDLLQTPAYAHALYRERYPRAPQHEVDLHLDLLAERQRRMIARGTLIWSLIPTTALHTHLPGMTSRHMADQHDYLRQRMAAGAAVQILPLHHPPLHLAGCPPVQLLRVAAPEIPDYAIELHPLGTRVHTKAETVSDYRALLDAVAARLPASSRTTLPTLDPTIPE